MSLLYPAHDFNVVLKTKKITYEIGKIKILETHFNFGKKIVKKIKNTVDTFNISLKVFYGYGPWFLSQSFCARIFILIFVTLTFRIKLTSNKVGTTLLGCHKSQYSRTRLRHSYIIIVLHAFIFNNISTCGAARSLTRCLF